MYLITEKPLCMQSIFTPGKDLRQIVTSANVGLLELSRCEAQTIRVILEILIAGSSDGSDISL